MKFTVAAIALLLVGYCLGGGVFEILEFLERPVWNNPLGEAIHDAVVSLDDTRLTDFYAAIRMDFRLGIISVLFGFLCFLGAMTLPRKLDILPWFFAVGIVARIWVPLTIELIELIPRVSAVELLAKFIPQLVWDIALIPACMLGTAMGRLVRIRRIPRWRIRSVGILTALLALWLTAGLQAPALLLPFATCGLIGLLSIWLLLQTSMTVGPSSNPAVNPSGESGSS
jgi:hypothetical protein